MIASTNYWYLLLLLLLLPTTNHYTAIKSAIIIIKKAFQQIRTIYFENTKKLMSTEKLSPAHQPEI